MIGILSKIVKINELTVIGIRIAEDGLKYSVLRGKKVGSRLKIISSGYIVTKEDLKKYGKEPVILVVDGKRILNKKVDLQNEEDIKWQKNIDINSLYIISFGQGNSKFLSFARRDLIEEQISEFREHGFDIIDVYIGPLPSLILQPEVKEEELISSGHLLEFSEGILKHVSKSDDLTAKDYKVASDIISSDHLPLYGALINHYLPESLFDKSALPSIDKEEIIYKKAFNVVGVSMVVGFFLMLLVSYSTTQFFLSKNIELNQQFIFSKQTYSQILEMESERDQKRKISKELGLSSKYFLSQLPYEVAKSIPNGVQLDKLSVSTIENELKNSKKVVFQPDIIFLKGSSTSEVAFNAWLGILKQTVIIKKFEIVSFKKDRKNMLQFEIIIDVNNV